MSAFLGQLGFMREQGMNANAIVAFWNIRCHFYGKDNLVKKAQDLDVMDTLRGLL